MPKNEFFVHLPNGDFNDSTDKEDLGNQIDFELATSNYPFVLVTREALSASQYVEISAFIEKVLKR